MRLVTIRFQSVPTTKYDRKQSNKLETKRRKYWMKTQNFLKNSKQILVPTIVHFFLDEDC